jgi:arylsulfatase A-like enzyme
MQIPELVSQVDLMPSILQAVGLAAPASVQGHSFLPLLERKTEGWRNEVFFQMSEFVTGRGLRTPQHTYAAMLPRTPGFKAVASGEKYVEYMLYDNYADPFQHVNLAGRTTHAEVSTALRKRLMARIEEAGDDRATIDPCWFPYS